MSDYRLLDYVTHPALIERRRLVSRSAHCKWGLPRIRPSIAFYCGKHDRSQYCSVKPIHPSTVRQAHGSGRTCLIEQYCDRYIATETEIIMRSLLRYLGSVSRSAASSLSMEKFFGNSRPARRYQKRALSRSPSSTCTMPCIQHPVCDLSSCAMVWARCQIGRASCRERV